MSGNSLRKTSCVAINRCCTSRSPMPIGSGCSHMLRILAQIERSHFRINAYQSRCTVFSKQLQRKSPTASASVGQSPQHNVVPFCERGLFSVVCTSTGQEISKPFAFLLHEIAIMLCL